MQEFIAYGRVASIPNDAVGRTSNGNPSFKFEFVCDSSLLDDQGKPLPSYFHVQIYGKQAEIMAQSLLKGSPILIKGEIIQRPYQDSQGQRRYYQYVSPDRYQGITFLESKEATNKRRLSLQTPTQTVTDYPEPFDSGEPF